MHSGIKFVKPHARHSGRDKEILKNREKVYREAKIRNPERWAGNIRNWDLIEKVDLNPDKEKMINKKRQPNLKVTHKLIVESLDFER